MLDCFSPGWGGGRDSVPWIVVHHIHPRLIFGLLCWGLRDCRDLSLHEGVWTVEHQRVCSVVSKTRQLIFLLVIDC